METEIWKPIPGCEGYEASNYGNIKSLRRTKSKVIRQHLKYDGYLLCSIKNKTTSVGRTIATTFIPNPENKPQVNHKNGIKTDNRVSNLEWASASENMMHAYKNKLLVPLIGMDHQNTKINPMFFGLIKETYFLKIGNQNQIARYFKVDQSVISRIINDKHGLYKMR